MNLDPQQIASIVQAVLQQLQNGSPLAAPVAGNAGGSVTGSHAGLVASTSVPSSAESATGAASIGTLQLTDAVITWELIRGRLSGIQSIRVGQRAVVTPLVRDELRRAGIRLERLGATGSVPSSSASPVASVALGLMVDEAARGLVRDVAAWAGSLATPTAAPALRASWSVQSRLEDLVAPLRAAAGAYRHAVVVTPRWAELAWQASREGNLRVAAVHSLETLDQAWRQLQPQLLVINSHQQSLRTLQSMLQSYAARASGAPMPAG